MHRVSKTRSRSLMLLLLVLMAVALFGILAQQALALPTFDKADKSIGPCDKCHTMSRHACQARHCGLRQVPHHEHGHSAASDGLRQLPRRRQHPRGHSAHRAEVRHDSGLPRLRRSGDADHRHRHGGPQGRQDPKTIKSQRRGHSDHDARHHAVAWVVQLKKGSKWVQVKAGAAKLGFLGGAMRFSYTYKPTKAGNYRSSASFKPGTSKITSKWVLFKAVKWAELTQPRRCGEVALSSIAGRAAGREARRPSASVPG